MPLTSTIRRRLQDHLAAMPIKPRQIDIAAAVGKTQTWVSHYLAGRHDADLDTLDRLCQFFGLELWGLIQDRPAQPRPELEELGTLYRSLSKPEQEALQGILRMMARPNRAQRARGQHRTPRRLERKH